MVGNMDGPLQAFSAESLKSDHVVSLTLYRILKGLVKEGFDLYTDAQGRLTVIRRARRP